MKRCRKKAVKWKGQDPREQMCLLSVTALSNPAKTTRSPRRGHILEGFPGERLFGEAEKPREIDQSFRIICRTGDPTAKPAECKLALLFRPRAPTREICKFSFYLLHTLAHLRSGCNQGEPFRWLCNFASSRKIIQKEMMKFLWGWIKKNFSPKCKLQSAKNVHTYTHIPTAQKE